MDQINNASQDGSNTLVVLLHAFSLKSISLKSVEEAVLNVLPKADIFRPELHVPVWSMKDPNQIVVDLLQEIDLKVTRAEESVRPVEKIILVGHSLGALLARKLYIVACGETSQAPFEEIYRISNSTIVAPRPWATKVDRIVLLAGMNRGWRISHHLKLKNALCWTIGSGVLHVVRLFSRRRHKRQPLIFTIRRGAEFITQLRIQWIRMRQRSKDSRNSENADSLPLPGNVLTIQLLGSVDDFVAPQDNVDLVSGGDFIFLDVPYSGHSNVIELNDKQYGAGRADRFKQAINLEKEQLAKEAVVPSDERFSDPDDSIEKMVFVIHGIRDEGYWTHKIARRVKKRAKSLNAEWATETSSYGYFPMLPFLFPWYRREKVEWLMDQYTEALARYPKASISYVGHSNGTYIMAKALELYPCCFFENVVFAGSVVSRFYDWQRYIKPESRRLNAILNFVATRDWVVAFFPKVFQFFGSKDLGSLGHDGFDVKLIGPNMYQVEHIEGGHGVAILEPMWDMIADFVIKGKTDTEQFPCKGEIDSPVELLVKWVGRFPLVAWISAGLFACGVWIGIRCLIGIAVADPMSEAFISGMAFVIFLFSLWLILTRL
jgi:pimeloyl-ACP methyl ester carboxylesterase